MFVGKGKYSKPTNMVVDNSSNLIKIGFNFNQSVVDNQGRVINTWVNIINCVNLGMEVMHERNARNFLYKGHIWF